MLFHTTVGLPVTQQRMSVTCDARYPSGYKQVVMRLKAWTDRTGSIPGDTAVIRASQVVPLCLAGSYQRTWLTVFSPCGKSFSHEGKPVSQCEMGFQTPREILACFGKFDTIIFQWREGRLLSVCSSLMEIYYQIGGRYSFTYYNLKSLPCLLS